MAMDKCQSFLNKLITPAEMRRENEAEEAVDALNMLENEANENTVEMVPVNKSGHINFGTFSFMSFANDSSTDQNKNGISEAEREERNENVDKEVRRSDDGVNLDDEPSDVNAEKNLENYEQNSEVNSDASVIGSYIVI
jgi:hypothetical protein